MKPLVVSIVVLSIWVAGAVGASVQTSDDVLATSTGQQTGLRKVLSDRPFFGTQNVLTLSGDYVNTPREDFEQSGVWSQQLALDQMDGAFAQVAFGEATKRGEWQLSYRHKLMNMDSDWQSIAVSSPSLTLSDRRSQVLKASYNIRDWWKLGVSAVVEDRYGMDSNIDPSTFDLSGRQSLGFQIDTSLKF